jgi:tetratricopeptide (TPR) repeat protein
VGVEIGQLAYSAANAVVGAMATDGWGAAKGLFRRWVKGHRRGGSDDLVGLLEQWREQLVRSGRQPDSEEFWRRYEQVQAALTVRFAMAAADDLEAQVELRRLRAEWLALPGVSARVAGSAAHLARVYGELLDEPRASAPPAFRRPALAAGRAVADLMPPGTSRFTDREEVLDLLRTRIERREDRLRIVNLCGEGGIGKTELAVKVSELVASSFPHGRLYADLRGSTGEGAAEPAEALERFLRAFDDRTAEVPGGEQARLDLYRSLTAGLGLVVLLDDAAAFAQVRPLIPASPTSLTIVTSRDPLPGLVEEFGATVVRVPPLDDANSLKLLRAVAGLDDPADPAAPASAVRLESVIRRCAGLPLAVCIEAARLAVGNVDQYLEPQAPVGEPARPELLAGYRDLPPEAVRLHRLLCERPWPSITAGPAAAAIGADEPVAATLLERLFQVNLLERASGSTVESPRYRVQNRVREEARRQVRTVEDARDVVAGTRAIVCWYLAFAVLADWHVNSRWRLGPLYDALKAARAEAIRTGVPERRDYPDEAAALTALEAEFDNLREAVQAADHHLFYDLVCQLCEAMWGVFLMRGHSQECVAVHRLGVVAAAATGDLKMRARMHVQLAFGLLWQDRLAEAEQEFELGFAADRQAGHDQGLATALESVGLVWLAREDFERAAQLFLQARTAAERAGDPRALALLDFHYGRALSGLGRFEEADVQFDRATVAFGGIRPRDEYNEGKILMSRGEAALRAGHPERAENPLAEAARILAEKGALATQGQVAVLRAWCARELGDLAAERRFLVDAQDFHARAGSRLAPRVLDRIRFLDAVSG